MSRILVIGATGTVGRAVACRLQTMGVEVRAVTRNPASAGLPAGTEVLAGDLTDPETLDAVLQGVESVFLVWTAPSAAFAPAFARIARHARRVVFLSAPLKTPHPFFQQPNPGRMAAEMIERTIEASGLEWTFLRPGMLAANAIRWWAPRIRAGAVVRWPYLSVHTAPIDELDIAAVAARALCEPGHAGAEYVITGPESLSQFHQLRIIGQVIGRELPIEEIPRDEALSEIGDLLSPTVAKMLLDAWAAAAYQPAFITPTVQELTGSAARTFREWAIDHASAFQP